MNRLIEPLKGVARDLVEKKLWPVAVLLVAALVAVPLLIGGSSADQAPPPAALAATAPAAGESKSLVTVAEPAAASGKDERSGKIDDPFYDPPAPPAADSGSGSSTAGGAASTATTPPATGGTPSPNTPGQATPQPATPDSKPVYYRTEVRWYEATAGKPRPLTRLTPLGGLADTAALYLGVTKSSGSYAVFLLGPNATSEGEAICEDDTNCRVIGLKAGQLQIVTVQPPDGGEARQYHLEVVTVRTIETDAATARTMRLKVHPDGRDVMREMWQNAPTADALRPIGFDRDSGLLVKTAAAPDGATTAAEPAE